MRPKHRRTLPSALRSLGSPSRQPLRGGWACLGWASRTMLLLGGQPKGRGREGARYEHSPENDPGREGVVVQLSSPVMGGGCPPAPGSYWSRCPRGRGRQMSRHAALPHVFDMCLSCSLDILGEQGLSSVLWGILRPCCGRGLIKAWVSSRLHVLREARWCSEGDVVWVRPRFSLNASRSCVLRGGHGRGVEPSHFGQVLPSASRVHLRHLQSQKPTMHILRITTEILDT